MKLKIVVLAVSLLTICGGQAAVLVYGGTLSGAAEAPPNASPATGTVTVTIDTSLETMRVQAVFIGLTGNSTAAHIHGATAVAGTGTAGVISAVPSFPGFPLGVTSGSMDQTFDLTAASTFNSSYVTAQGGTVAGARTAFLTALSNGTTYFNLHTSAFPGGEIRTFLTPIPEPSVAVFALGTAWLMVRRRR